MQKTRKPNWDHLIWLFLKAVTCRGKLLEWWLWSLFRWEAIILIWTNSKLLRQ